MNLRNLFLARVPIEFLAIACTLAAFSLFNPIVEGLFTLSSGYSLSLVALAAGLLGLGATSSINLILEHGHERMDPAAGVALAYAPYSPDVRIYALSMITALWFIGSCIWRSGLAFWTVAAAVIGGLALAHVLVLGAVVLEVWFSDPTLPPPNMLILPAPTRLTAKGGLLDRLKKANPPASDLMRKALDRLARLAYEYAGPLLPGYVYGAGTPSFYPGIIFNAAFFLIASFTWFYSVWNSQSDQPVQQPGSLSFVLLAFLVLTLLFSGASYFLDRYRIPLSLVSLVYIALVGSSSGTDHFYRVVASPGAEFHQPSEVLHSRKIPIVVMAAGGGIQSAAWMTRILARLDEIPGFRSNIALISSVSGGSLGAYYTAVAYHNNLCFEKAANWALEPSLDEAAWGWMGPDLLRAFFPYVWKREIDRGWALETAWDRITSPATGSAHQDLFINQLAAETTKTTPAFVFNASVIEDGSPFVITTTAFPDSERTRRRRVIEFNRLYRRQQQIRVSTAARLSASFPFVAPAARGDAHPLIPDYHLVDGGYYDNFGILSGLDWLDQATAGNAAQMPAKVALILIRWGDQPDAVGTMQGWRYQLSAPLQAVLSIRGKEQLREDKVALDAFRRQFSKSHICVFEFVYAGAKPCDKQPNSWKFTSTQSTCIATTAAGQSENIEKVRRFLQ